MDINKMQNNIIAANVYISGVENAEKLKLDPKIKKELTQALKQLNKEKASLEAETKRGKIAKLIWAVGRAIKRIFVREKSFEEKINNTFLKIYPHIAKEDRENALEQFKYMPPSEQARLRLKLAETIKTYAGGVQESEKGDKVARVQELLVGIGADIGLVPIHSPETEMRNLPGLGVQNAPVETIYIPDQFSKELGRLSLNVGDEQFSSSSDAFEALKQLESVVPDERARQVLLNCAHQGLIGSDLMQTLITDITNIIGFTVYAGGVNNDVISKDEISPGTRLSIFRDKSDLIHLKIETGFYICRPDAEEVLNKPLGGLGVVAASREIVIPEKQLKDLGAYFAKKDAELGNAVKESLKSREGSPDELRVLTDTLKKERRQTVFSDPEEVAKLIPGFRLIDSYSRVVGLEDGAVNAYHKAAEELGSNS